MSHANHGFKHELFSALNRCVAAPFFTMIPGEKQKNTHPAFEAATRILKNRDQERYLAIPTFIRQGKTLGV